MARSLRIDLICILHTPFKERLSKPIFSKTTALNLSAFLSLENTYYAFGCAVALVCGCAGDQFPAVIAEQIKLVFDLVGLNVSAPKTFRVIRDCFVLVFVHYSKNPQILSEAYDPIGLLKA